MSGTVFADRVSAHNGDHGSVVGGVEGLIARRALPRSKYGRRGHLDCTGVGRKEG